MDTQKAVVDQMVNSYSGLVKNIDGASDSTKRALLDTVNTSSDVLLQKLDATQQDRANSCQVPLLCLLHSEASTSPKGYFAKPNVLLGHTWANQFELDRKPCCTSERHESSTLAVPFSDICCGFLGL